MPRELHPDPKPPVSDSDIEITDGYWAIPNGPETHSTRANTDDMGSLAVDDTFRKGSSPIPVEGTTSYVGPNNFELTTTDELRAAIKEHGFGATRREFGDLVRDILSDPFGENNIDAFVESDAGQWVRLVHKVTGPLEELVQGRKLAIKGTGLDMESGRKFLGGARRVRLHEQFRTTLRAQRAQEQQAPEGVDGLIYVNKAFGMISYRDEGGKLQEWMLMDYVEDAEPVEEQRVVMSIGGTKPGFFASDYPELAELVNPHAAARARDGVMGDELILFEDLADHISRRLGLRHGELDDLGGHNLLKQDTPDGPKYTIIDVQSHR